MLHKFDKIEDAMAACVSLEYPLMVTLHDRLPSVLNNADEATRGSGAGGMAGGRSAAGLTFPFLPASHASITRASSSLFADASDSWETAHAAPDLAMATANASLGYLMRPANLTAAAAANASAMAQALADGEELALVPDFPLGSIQGGAAQREALLVTLLESRLGSVTLLHLIEAETPDYAAFSAAVQATPGTPAAALPRVHIFFPPSAGMAPVVLSGKLLTPQNLYNCVQAALLKPKTHASQATAPGGSHELTSFFSASVSAMNREYLRARQQSSPASSNSDSGATTVLQQRHSDPSSTAKTAPGGQQPATTAPIMAVPAQRAKGVANVDALGAAHLISVAGLPMSFTSSATTVAAYKTILTTPSMTLQTVWRAVEKHLEWAQREVQQAQAASTWNGITPPKPGAKFNLTIEAPMTSKEAVSVTATTVEEAAKVRLQDYPRSTLVQVCFEDVSPPSPAVTAPAASTPATGATPAPRPSEYVCEGEVCRRRAPDDTPVAAAANAPPSPPKESAPTAASAPASEAASEAASVRLRCSLPNGKTLDVAQLDPSVNTLRADVRPTVADALGYNNFVFVCAYPPKRYSTETDEGLPLKEVGLGRSSALRVVPLDSPASPKTSRNGEAQQQQQQQPPGPARAMLFGAASSLMAMFAGARGNRGEAPGTAAGASPSPASSQARRPHRTYNSMAEMLAANEEAERQRAMERLRQEQQGLGSSSSALHPLDAEQRAQGKKSNRYFGGGSTEFIAEDGSDGEGGSDSEGKRAAMAGLTPQQQEAFLCEQLRQLMSHHQRQPREADKNEDDAEEGGEEGAQGRVGGQGAFQGQGRRLAGDAPPASGGSAHPASPYPPSPSDSVPAAGAEETK
ncbi:hypothetical protein LSCM1_00852 [Leishmania martiniquensis]|uniref:UBX domain-containing protein n=1 Tax=Leishmania martiniquensis TaxID=1580590 RepID=A0A836GFQ4_9TRYP|nr:hypothetical protein LSCM1_00852 [Leishmania martiniquensis]